MKLRMFQVELLDYKKHSIIIDVLKKPKMVEILMDLKFTYMFVDVLKTNNWPESRLNEYSRFKKWISKQMFKKWISKLKFQCWISKQIQIVNFKTKVQIMNLKAKIEWFDWTRKNANNIEYIICNTLLSSKYHNRIL